MEELNLSVEDFGSKVESENIYQNSELLKIILSASPQANKAYTKVLQTLNDVVMHYK